MPELFRNRVFLVVAGADLLQQIGIWIRNMALLYYVMEQTNNNPAAVALLTVFEYLPIFVFAMIGGTFADRWNPKRTVIVGDALSAVSIAVILALVTGGRWQAAFAATVVSAVVSQFSQPASAVLFKRHVPERHVQTAVGFTQTMTALFMIGGPPVGTFVYTRFGIEWSLSALVAVFAAASLVQLLLPSTPRARDGGEKPSTLKDLRDGIRYVAGHRTLSIAAVMFLLIGLAAGIVHPLDVFVVMERLGLEKEAVQWFAMLGGAGLLIGGGLAAGLSGLIDRHRSRIVPWTLVIFGVCTFVEVLSVWPVLTGGVRLLSGVALTFLQVVLGALMIREVEEAYVGRTNGIILPVMMGGLVTGSAISGLLVRQATLFGAYGLAAALLILCALVATRIRYRSAEEASAVSGESV
ncbi:MAG: MFS transporter [Thermobacillus sp. ZCTH02-B1]|uniref:MFS transporter n=1 Tax=Thermobacillus sp. ZCTH02-B1 TaxID=1858795 RepID=UPI000B563407|nr:MFS transporter [Thermobacillus sp. ZCTH02-B1]OUM95780.1 MAG: MFS transporter [Thermobacillus sp. ZCTH02-B1]